MHVVVRLNLSLQMQEQDCKLRINDITGQAEAVLGHHQVEQAFLSSYVNFFHQRMKMKSNVCCNLCIHLPIHASDSKFIPCKWKLIKSVHLMISYSFNYGLNFPIHRKQKWS
ncbi:hypothetical protein Dimus_017765 [Dionaea muscipula]